jgi:hypothetical protein
MKKKGSELIFISRIKRDGSGVELLDTPDGKTEIELSQNDMFEINCLSISKGTYIASEMNSYVVKLR